MAPDLSEKLLGIDIGDSQEQNRQRGSDEDQEELAQFVFFDAGGHRLALPVDDVRTLAEVPDEFTRVPRSPAAIEGMVDLRGEITAVIDPRVHFPNGDGAEDEPGDDERATVAAGNTFADQERLLVLDRPADQQAAAVRADEVLGVETIPESAILDEAAVEDRTLPGEALAHPLVAALIEQERTVGGSSVAASAAVDVGPGAGGDAGSVAAVPSAESNRSGADAVGAPFELEATEASETTAESTTETATSGRTESAPPQEVVVEVTPLIDVDRLLLASGQRE